MSYVRKENKRFGKRRMNPLGKSLENLKGLLKEEVGANREREEREGGTI